MCIVVGRDKWKFFLREDPAFHNEVCLWVEIMKNVEVIPSLPSPRLLSPRIALPSHSSFSL